MTVPDYQSVMLPLLKFAAEKKDETSTGEVVEVLTKVFRLTEEDLKELPPSGIQSTFVSRVGWAATYMKKAGLLEATRRGYYRITPRGQDLLKKQPKTINVKLLKQYPEFLEFQQLKGTRSGARVDSSSIATRDPAPTTEAAAAIRLAREMGQLEVRVRVHEAGHQDARPEIFRGAGGCGRVPRFPHPGDPAAVHGHAAAPHGRTRDRHDPGSGEEPHPASEVAVARVPGSGGVSWVQQYGSPTTS